jgi:hypothetical protein
MVIVHRRQYRDRNPEHVCSFPGTEAEFVAAFESGQRLKLRLVAPGQYRVEDAIGYRVFAKEVQS